MHSSLAQQDTDWVERVGIPVVGGRTGWAFQEEGGGSGKGVC